MVMGGTERLLSRLFTAWLPSGRPEVNLNYVPVYIHRLLPGGRCVQNACTRAYVHIHDVLLTHVPILLTITNWLSRNVNRPSLGTP